MPEYGSVNRHPLTSLFYLVLFIVLGYALFSATAIGILYIFTGSIKFVLNAEGSKNIILFMQAWVSIGTFVLPPIALYYYDKHTGIDYLRINTPLSGKLIFLTALIMFIVSPFIEWVIMINQMMHLPSFLQGVEDWMRDKEKELGELTKQILIMKSPVDLLINLLILAIIPAIGEEFLFRGCFQSIFTRITKNQHAGIWITAFLFSAIHVQFLGFFPRMFLGALFGYLFLWGGSIWLAVLAHFINNATAVVGAYVLQMQGKPLDSLDNPHTSIFIAAGSLLFTLLICGVFYKISKEKIKL
ncbi:abortive infection protein family [Arcticibacter svalbardensis MN12-7]|uniref:Abortive infection protein family n=1 Tax=Arcticibacter svalbardensis MN12-7 TaxID=1150600 RepID=R9GVN8_9SPHI|nr:CPBP family intramembrane glutamic endopeptidase [Arcticibacter svalbardensis]EOR95912.1 abortive infection protein family [Arcticibacter svalbardensis MN12-7]